MHDWSVKRGKQSREVHLVTRSWQQLQQESHNRNDTQHRDFWLNERSNTETEIDPNNKLIEAAELKTCYFSITFI